MTSNPRPRRVRRLLTIAIVAFGLLGTACAPSANIAFVFGGADGQDTRLVDQANRVAQCESKMDPNAVSATNDHGLFQINAVHRQEFEQVTGQPWSKVYDPYWNSVFAKWMYDQQGWSPWSCHRVL